MPEELPIPLHKLAGMTLADIYWRGWSDGHERGRADYAGTPAKFANILSRRIDELGLSTSTYRSLARDGIRDLGDLIQCSETRILCVRQIGPKNLQEVKDRLGELGHSLRPPAYEK
ncbi:MAG TPA: DNA-directed RNA polymerase subunit alpha C-terminal domain-containing protein [Candidatus Bathyarchaeia archaeon]|nr:DNA-directed RNA polymerase subunit alpha C-terminal domain-containing protein [Candidatus Bathyarchaeia archaeon]